MLRSARVAVFMVLFAGSASAADRFLPSAAPSGDEAVHSTSPVAARASLPRLERGDSAPDFSYLSADGWQPFPRLFATGPVLLVFGASEDELRALARAGSAFHELGVRPLAVLDLPTGAAKRLGRRIGLGDPFIADPRCVIAGLFGSLDPDTRRHAPAYFVVDAQGVVRGLGYGRVPSVARLLAISAGSLGLPLPAAARVLSMAE